MKVYAVVSEYYSYEYTMDSDFTMELFATEKDAKMYFEIKKEDCFNYYLNRYEISDVDDLKEEYFEDYDEGESYMSLDIYDDCSEYIYIKEYDIMSFKEGN